MCLLALNSHVCTLLDLWRWGTIPDWRFTISIPQEQITPTLQSDSLSSSEQHSPFLSRPRFNSLFTRSPSGVILLICWWTRTDWPLLCCPKSPSPICPPLLSWLCGFRCFPASTLTTLKQTRRGKNIQKVLIICFSCHQWELRDLTAGCYADLQLQFPLSLLTCTRYFCYFHVSLPKVRQAGQASIPRAPSAATTLNSSQFPFQASLVCFLHIWPPLSLGRPRLAFIPQEKIG